MLVHIHVGLKWNEKAFVLLFCDGNCTYTSDFISVEVGSTFLCTPSVLGVGYVRDGHPKSNCELEKT